MLATSCPLASLLRHRSLLTSTNCLVSHMGNHRGHCLIAPSLIYLDSSLDQDWRERQACFARRFMARRSRTLILFLFNRPRFVSSANSSAPTAVPIAWLVATLRCSAFLEFSAEPFATSRRRISSPILNSTVLSATCCARSPILRFWTWLTITLAFRRWLFAASFASPMRPILFPVFVSLILDKRSTFTPPSWIWSPRSAPLPSAPSISPALPAPPLPCAPATRSSVAPAPAEPHPTWGSACRPMPASPRKLCAPAKSCYATTPSATRGWTWRVAAVWGSDPSWSLRCV